ncbi:hypothetical protein ACS0TY_030855 [Phlomoides rotata]
MMSGLFPDQISFKTFRPQTSFPYLGERRFRGLGYVRSVPRSDLVYLFLPLTSTGLRSDKKNQI